MNLEIKELTTKQEMLAQFEVMQHLYTKFTLEKYDSYLTDMIPHNYKQVAVFEHDICIGISGLWSGTKLWSGKYLEIDNFIVHPDHRKKGVGKMMTDYIDAKAKETPLPSLSEPSWRNKTAQGRQRHDTGATRRETGH